MSYEFDSVESGTPAGNAAETCAMLHLMCFAENRDEIEAFAIDCFNDVTGMDASCFKLHDAQSKAGKETNPAKLGEELATLFENHVSDFSGYFSSLTLFVGGVSSSVREDSSKTEFCFDDLTKRAQESVKTHLEITSKKRHKAKFSDKVTDENVSDFLSKVRIVIFKNKTDYIRSLAQESSKLFPDDEKLNRIFSEIRDTQSRLKNKQGIEGKQIERPDAVMDFGRVLKVRDIKLLVIERLLNRDFLKNDSPISFVDYVKKHPHWEVDKDDVTEDSKNELSAQYLDKNNNDAFWKLLDEIVAGFQENPNADIEEVYNAINTQTLINCTHMNKRSHLFFIATVKEGLKK